MTESTPSDVPTRIRAGLRNRLQRLRWWFALRVGGAPNCAVCGDEAAWIAETEDEPRCFRHIPSEGSDAIRDVQPADCFADWESDE